MKRELEMLTNEPPPGISCWNINDKLDELRASILGNEESPFESGIFKLEINIPNRYPFEPPVIKFITPIYHPNIDNGGRICLDLLKMKPKGCWRPSLNIATLLKSIQLLMSHPNPQDPLMADIANEFSSNKCLFVKKAKEWTQKYAMDEKITKQKEIETTDSRKRTSMTDEDAVPAKRILSDVN